jgi:hypothetical protein
MSAAGDAFEIADSALKVCPGATVMHGAHISRSGASHLSSNLAFITESGFARPQSCGLQVSGRRPGEFAH